jgi:hypothetical protein
VQSLTLSSSRSNFQEYSGELFHPIYRYHAATVWTHGICCASDTFHYVSSASEGVHQLTYSIQYQETAWKSHWSGLCIQFDQRQKLHGFRPSMNVASALAELSATSFAGDRKTESQSSKPYYTDNACSSGHPEIIYVCIRVLFRPTSPEHPFTHPTAVPK